MLALLELTTLFNKLRLIGESSLGDAAKWRLASAGGRCQNRALLTLSEECRNECEIFEELPPLEIRLSYCANEQLKYNH